MIIFFNKCYSSRCDCLQLIPEAGYVYRLQGRDEVKWRPEQEASFTLPCSNSMSIGSKGTVLKKILMTLSELFGARGFVPPCPPSIRP